MNSIDLKEYIVVVGSVKNPELTTHLNYVYYIRQKTKNLKFSYNNDINYHANISKIKFDTRVNLVKLTYKSLQEEARQVESTHEYARACSAWVAIKGYYLLFYLETILMSLIEAQNKMKASHGEVRKYIKTLSANKTLSASFPDLTKVIKHADCETTGLKSGANLKGQLSEQDRYRQVMKKLREYSQEEYKRVNKIKSLRGESKKKFNNMNISLTDFFYWYRIKSNYRDLEFIAGEEAKVTELYDFYRMYNQSVIAYAAAYIRLINSIYSMRINKNTELISGIS